MPFVAESLIAEEKRIREAYARRQSGHLYSRFNPGYLLMVQEREKCLLRLLSRYHCEDLDRKKFLEIGCGSGDLLRDFIKWGARPENMAGVELLSERIAEAVHLCPKAIEIRQCNAAILDYSDETFDVVVQSTVFTSVQIVKYDYIDESLLLSDKGEAPLGYALRTTTQRPPYFLGRAPHLMKSRTAHPFRETFSSSFAMVTRKQPEQALLCTIKR